MVEVSTRHLVLAADAAIDLQLHTTFSDGTWTPELLYMTIVADKSAVRTVNRRLRGSPMLVAKFVIGPVGWIFHLLMLDDVVFPLDLAA